MNAYIESEYANVHEVLFRDHLEGYFLEVG